MDDLEKYIKKRKAKSKEFAKDFEIGYENFKIGIAYGVCFSKLPCFVGLRLRHNAFI